MLIEKGSKMKNIVVVLALGVLAGCNSTSYVTPEGERLIGNTAAGWIVGEALFGNCGAGAAVGAGATIIDDQK